LGPQGGALPAQALRSALTLRGRSPHLCVTLEGTMGADAVPTNKKVRLAVAILLGLAGLFVVLNERVQFVAGGALINLGYRMQDHLGAFDLVHHEAIRSDEVWREVLTQNHWAASVRKYFPRHSRHPLVALVVCMDARIDTSELIGDTRKYYYIIRTAGSVLSEKEEEMLELAVVNGVKAIVLTTHSDCAAERAAKDPLMRARFPALTGAVDERAQRVRELMERPAIAAKLASGQLLLKRMHIDTATDEMRVLP